MSVSERIKMWWKKTRCDHEYQWYEKVNSSGFANIQGRTIVNRCDKCGHIKSEQFQRYEGNGFK